MVKVSFKSKDAEQKRAMAVASEESFEAALVEHGVKPPDAPPEESFEAALVEAVSGGSGASAVAISRGSSAPTAPPKASRTTSRKGVKGKRARSTQSAPSKPPLHPNPPPQSGKVSKLIMEENLDAAWEYQKSVMNVQDGEVYGNGPGTEWGESAAAGSGGYQMQVSTDDTDLDTEVEEADEEEQTQRRQQLQQKHLKKQLISQQMQQNPEAIEVDDSFQSVSMTNGGQGDEQQRLDATFLANEENAADNGGEEGIEQERESSTMGGSADTGSTETNEEDKTIGNSSSEDDADDAGAPPAAPAPTRKKGLFRSSRSPSPKKKSRAPSPKRKSRAPSPKKSRGRALSPKKSRGRSLSPKKSSVRSLSPTKKSRLAALAGEPTPEKPFGDEDVERGPPPSEEKPTNTAAGSPKASRKKCCCLCLALFVIVAGAVIGGLHVAGFLNIPILGDGSDEAKEVEGSSTATGAADEGIDEGGAAGDETESDPPTASSDDLTIEFSFTNSSSTVGDDPLTTVSPTVVGQPTGSPISVPTSADPTAVPTSAPTLDPTVSSSPTTFTREPTISASPTTNPIVAPTGDPTSLPTATPTAGPTEGPTASPVTSAPTPNPTKRDESAAFLALAGLVTSPPSSDVGVTGDNTATAATALSTLASTQDPSSAQYAALEWMTEEDSFFDRYDTGDGGVAGAIQGGDPAALEEIRQRYAVAVIGFGLNVNDSLKGRLEDRRRNKQRRLRSTAGGGRGGLRPDINKKGKRRMQDPHPERRDQSIESTYKLYAGGWFWFSDVCDWEGVICKYPIYNPVTDSTEFIDTPPFAGGPSKVVTEIRLPRLNLNGHIPSEIGTAFASTLTYLDLADNEIGGTLPSSLYQCSGLTGLYLENNDIGGELTDGVANWVNMQGMYLGGNRFEGGLPKKLNAMRNSLRYLSITHNQFTGPFPKLALRMLFYLDASYNRFTGLLPLDLGSRYKQLQVVYLDHNQFVGPIPKDYIHIGQDKLHELHLNDNYLCGGVPEGFPHLYDYNKFLFAVKVQNNRLTEPLDDDTCKMSVLNDNGEFVEMGTDCSICQCKDGERALCNLGGDRCYGGYGDFDAAQAQQECVGYQAEVDEYFAEQGGDEAGDKEKEKGGKRRRN